MSSYVSESEQGVTLRVQVQTRSSRDEVVGLHGKALKIRITSPPVGGAANKHLLRFLAKKLKVPRNQLIIHTGATSRVKCIVIRGISASEVHQLLAK
ncbi:MAG: YggU family protein [Deltaproteobacteria bacterium]|nr:MAG: YggU family protein [Deltaproteobacteria bacterium]